MEKTLREIIDYAVWAPSGDNSQPWFFKIKGETIELYIDPDKDNPILNFKLSGTYISAGAVLGTIKIAATHYGLEAEFRLFPNPQDKTFIASINFVKSSAQEDELFRFIKERCTNRKPYKNVSLSSEQKRKLFDSATNISEARLVIVDEAQKVKSIAKACSTTEKIALETPALHRLFFKNLVWSREEEQKKGIGLYIVTLELPPPIRLLFKVLKHWSVAKLLNKIGFSKIAAKGNARTYAKSAALCAIVIKNHTPQEFINAGRLTQRVWLTATALGLSVQPVTGIFFFITRWKKGDVSDFLPKHLPEIQKAYEIVYPAFGLENETIAMHLRLGMTNKPTARSLRVEPKIVV